MGGEKFLEKKELFKNFEDNWGRFLSPFEIEDISKWIDEDGFSEEVVNEALRETVNYNVKNMHYLNRILSKWKSEKVTTLEAVKHTREQWALAKSKNRLPATTVTTTSNIPGWSDESLIKREATAEENRKLAELQAQMMQQEEV